MKGIRRVAIALVVASLAGCATSYGSETWTGGFQEQQLAAARWRVTFSANGYTSRETAQTYWLYRCAQLALEKNYDGFRIITPMQLIAAPRTGGAAARITPVQFDMPVDHTKPWISGEIEMLHGPVRTAPPQVFDAARLKAALEPHVNGPKCDGNVCPHFHDYLFATPPQPQPASPPAAPHPT